MGQQRQAACETVGSTVRDVWSTTPEVRQSVVLCAVEGRTDARKQVEVDEFLGSVGRLLVSWLAFPKVHGLRSPICACVGRGVGRAPQYPG